MVRLRHERKPTIYDIALAAHASPTTVSFVLNGSWQSHRIKQETATRVLHWAEQLGYAVNLKARGLRLSRSGLAGMILPHYRNRFFAGLAEAFEAEARSRGLCPIVVSTHRHPGNELTVTETLLAQQVEFLFFTGVREPTPLNQLCNMAKVRCVNIDLPGAGAASVVSDNRGGAKQLTEIVLRKLKAFGADPADIFFFGGVAADDATHSRADGFKDALSQIGVVFRPEMIDCCGYQPSHAAASLAARHAKLGRLPAGLFVNGVTALEGALRFTSTLPTAELRSIAVGSFDWDPFAAHLPFDVTMVRQDVQAMIAEGFALIDNPHADPKALIVVPTSFDKISDLDGALDGAAEDWNEETESLSLGLSHSA